MLKIAVGKTYGRQPAQYFDIAPTLRIILLTPLVSPPLRLSSTDLTFDMGASPGEL